MVSAGLAKPCAESGAEILLSINGSPFEADKQQARIQLAVQRVVETGLPFVFCAQVVRPGRAGVRGRQFRPQRRTASLAVQMPFFEEAVTLTEWHARGERLVCAPQQLPPEPARLEGIYRAHDAGAGRLCAARTAFPGVILGLSGGIDSALSAAVAVDALGPDRVRAFMLPSPYTSQESLDDAAACAQPARHRLRHACRSPRRWRRSTPRWRRCSPACSPTSPRKTSSRRARGLILMAMSNKFGPMLLTTGNKSEMSVGYATLYGDMCGGYSVLKDVYKTTVFALTRWRNAHRPPGALGRTGR